MITYCGKKSPAANAVGDSSVRRPELCETGNDNVVVTPVETVIDGNQTDSLEDVHYTCICTAVNKVLFYCRIFGILPITPSGHESENPSCKYRVSLGWIIYGIVIQILYSGYVIIMYYSRISCGPSGQLMLEWYVMTLGYFFNDLDSLFTLFLGTLFARRSCRLLQQMSTIPGLVQAKVYNLERQMVLGTRSLLIAFTLVLCTYLYVAWLRHYQHFNGSYHCTMSERPFAVILRGVTIVISTLQIAAVMMIILVIKSKFLTLAKSTEYTLSNFNKEAKYFGNLLERLSSIHKDISLSVKELNKCMGLQSLISISSSLYNTIYYLYRYNTATDFGLTSNYDERVHYIVGLLHRIGKLLVYMVLGQLLTTSSIKPLDVLQSSSIINLPNRLQQQIQTLILQWSGKRNSFSAVGVINIGPWLLAPIIGNVITYLLVAIQFQQYKT